MFFTSKKKLLAKNARAIKIAENSNLPQLHRLYTDFSFVVMALCDSTSTPKRYALCEVGLDKHEDSSHQVTPEFQSLSELEAYTEDHVVDILQKYLFGEEALDDGLAMAI
ncbi:MAG: hypothetical protein KTR20_11380 [Cellvibrionaceae bacterium]|nr:hypothetical protein [Cellvibrionaceae bacterium]